MAPNGNDRGGLVTAGGILSIVAGVLELLAGAAMLALVTFRIPLRLWILPLLPDVPARWFEHGWTVVPIWPMIIGGLFLVLAIIAIVGGVSAIKRMSFGLSLAGAILRPSVSDFGSIGSHFCRPGKEGILDVGLCRSGGKADALRSGRSALKGVRVQIPPSAPV
jgi:hypothetical protein